MAESEVVEEMPSQTTSEVGPEVEPENVPLPRSSMVSVRLSDIPFDPDLDIIDEREIPREVSVPRSSPSSTRSSRSSSQTSESSLSIDSVNWEGLEKTEEQEPKDDGTDEVSLVVQRTSNTTNKLSSPRPCYWHVWRKRMLP